MTRRALHEALLDHPLFFAPVLPSLRSPAHRIAERVDETASILLKLPRVDAVYVPELVDENHEGRPRYRSYDPREYAVHVTSRTGHPGIVTKVVAHFPTAGALREWAERTVRMGVRNVVLVGGSSSRIPYPGPAVEEADRTVRPILDSVGGELGNISIPHRSGEAGRMLRKTQAGATFLTTQLLFEAEGVIEVLREYGRLCREVQIAPATVVLSFAPLGDDDDIEFVRWLGANLPEEVEQALLQEEQALSRRTVELALSVWTAVVTATSSSGVPLGVSVEQVSARHRASATDLATEFSAVLPAPRSSSLVEPPRSR
ncbi:MAG: mycobacterial-type methylenetetrahydrofolate reductase [Thermoplasmata archaeon]